jgi:hypothetical protein
MLCSECDSSVEILATRKGVAMCLACVKTAWEKELAGIKK